jgi:hypothetical protein
MLMNIIQCNRITCETRIWNSNRFRHPPISLSAGDGQPFLANHQVDPSSSSCSTSNGVSQRVLSQMVVHWSDVIHTLRDDFPEGSLLD